VPSHCPRYLPNSPCALSSTTCAPHARAISRIGSWRSRRRVVHRDDGARARPTTCSSFVSSRFSVSGRTSDESRCRAAQHEGVDRRDEGERRHHDLVARPDLEQQRPRSSSACVQRGRQQRAAHAQRGLERSWQRRVNVWSPAICPMRIACAMYSSSRPTRVERLNGNPVATRRSAAERIGAHDAPPVATPGRNRDRDHAFGTRVSPAPARVEAARSGMRGIHSTFGRPGSAASMSRSAALRCYRGVMSGTARPLLRARSKSGRPRL